MTISLNISTNQKDSGLNSLLLGQQSGQSADFDSQFEGELSGQLSTDRQDLAAATHGYDDYQQQHASKQVTTNASATQSQASSAETSVAVARAQTTAAPQTTPASAETTADSLLSETAPAQGDILMAVISQSQAIKQLQSKTPQSSVQAEPAAAIVGLAPIKPTLTTTTDSDIQAASELAANVLANAVVADSATPTVTKTSDLLADLPPKFRKLAQKPQLPCDPKPKVEQPTSAKTADEATDDLALDAVSYWQLRQQQKEQANTDVATKPTATAPEQNAQVEHTQLTAAVSLAGEGANAATERVIEAPETSSSEIGGVEPKSTNARSALATTELSDKAATLVATAQDSETKAPASATAPTIEQPVAPIKAVTAEAGSAKEVPVTSATTVAQATSTQGTPASQTNNESSSGVGTQPSLIVARPPQEGAPVQRRSLLPSELEIEQPNAESAAAQSSLVASSGAEKAVIAPSRVGAEHQPEKLAALPIAETTHQDKPIVTAISEPKAEPQVVASPTAPSPTAQSTVQHEATTSTNDAAFADVAPITTAANATPDTVKPQESHANKVADASVTAQQAAASVPVSVLPEPVTSREPQWVAAEASTVAAAVAPENSKATTAATERPAAAEQKQTYAEFMQQSNQQQGEQQSQQQHKDQPALARQLESTVAANPDTTPAVRATSVDAPASTATAAVTSHAAATPIGNASLTSHVNKLTETLKNAEVAQQQVPLDLQQPNAATKLAERVMYQVHQKIQSAEVQLHPEDLGAMQIKVSLQQDQLSVQFVVQQGAAKEALEQQMPRLKDMLQQQGMQLAEGQVEQRQSQQGEQRQAQGQSRSQSASGDDVDAGTLVQQGQVQVKVSDRAVDYYA